MTTTPVTIIYDYTTCSNYMTTTPVAITTASNYYAYKACSYVLTSQVPMFQELVEPTITLSALLHPLREETWQVPVLFVFSIQHLPFANSLYKNQMHVLPVELVHLQLYHLNWDITSCHLLLLTLIHCFCLPTVCTVAAHFVVNVFPTSVWAVFLKTLPLLAGLCILPSLLSGICAHWLNSLPDGLY